MYESFFAWYFAQIYISNPRGWCFSINECEQLDANKSGTKRVFARGCLGFRDPPKISICAIEQVKEK